MGIRVDQNWLTALLPPAHLHQAEEQHQSLENYAEANRAQLVKEIPYFRFVFDSGLKLGNPIHQVIYWFSDLEATQEENDRFVASAYEFTKHALEYAKKENPKEPDPKKKMAILSVAIFAMGGQGFQMGYFNNHFNKDIAEEDGFLACTTVCGVGNAIAFELNWPLKTVLTSDHCYFRWGDDFGYDLFGPTFPQLAESDDVLDLGGLQAFFLYNRAEALYHRENYDGALNALEEINRVLDRSPLADR